MGVVGTMLYTRSIFGAAGAAACALVAMTGAASAEDKPAFVYSFNVGVTTDYVFRGYSQKKEDPALQGGVDLSYTVMPNVVTYFGIWGSGVDFGINGDGTRLAGAELDVYGGAKYTMGCATFDLGVIWYTYPGANDRGPAVGEAFQQNYVEFKAGVSGAFIPSLDKLTTGATVFYSPSYQGGQGEVVTIEGTAAYELPKIWVFVPSISGTIGGQFGSDGKNQFLGTGLKGFALGNGEDSLAYWNAGMTFTLDKLSFDFRYWDTSVKNNNAAGGGLDGWCTGAFNQCDLRYVFTAKFTY